MRGAMGRVTSRGTWRLASALAVWRRRGVHAAASIRQLSRRAAKASRGVPFTWLSRPPAASGRGPNGATARRRPRRAAPPCGVPTTGDADRVEADRQPSPMLPVQRADLRPAPARDDLPGRGSTCSTHCRAIPVSRSSAGRLCIWKNRGRSTNQPRMPRATLGSPPPGVSVRSTITVWPRPARAIAASNAATVASSPRLSLIRMRSARPRASPVIGGGGRTARRRGWPVPASRGAATAGRT